MRKVVVVVSLALFASLLVFSSRHVERPRPIMERGGSGEVSPVDAAESGEGFDPFDVVVDPGKLDYARESVATLSPGDDTSLCMRWEPTVAVDPNSPNVIAVAQGGTAQVSLDSGETFTSTILAAPPMACDDGMTPCSTDLACTGIGSGVCYPGQCDNGTTYCSSDDDCPGIGEGTCNGFRQGDPSVAFDSQGRLFFTYLCKLPVVGRDVCITGYELNDDGDSFERLDGVDWPVNVSAAAGGGGLNADKEWLAADSFSASPFADRLYVVWTNLSGVPDWTILTSYSSDQGQTWSPAVQLSAADGSEGLVWPAHNTVAPNGDVYVAYHSQTGFVAETNREVPDGVSGQIFVTRSTSGGESYSVCEDGTTPCTQDADCAGIDSEICTGKSLAFLPGEADTTWNVQSYTFCEDGTTVCTEDADCLGIGIENCQPPAGVIPGTQFWLMGTSQPWILADPAVEGRVYVVANDDPDDVFDDGDAADVFIATSEDNGATWTIPARVDSGAVGTFQVMPTAAIDPVTGSIAVTYYDNRAQATNSGGNFLLDLFAAYSRDGGVDWLPEIDFNDGMFDPDSAESCRFCGNGGPTNLMCDDPACAPGPGTTRIGEYNGVAFGECTAYAVWADNTVPECDGDTDVYFDRDPEAGGDMEAPVPACPDDIEIACTESTEPDNTGMASATDNCVLEPDIEFGDEVTPGDCPQESTIERSWTATDRVGNSESCLQTISVVDDTPPVVTPPEPIKLECNSTGGVPSDDPVVELWLDSATAVDDCGESLVTNDAPDLFPSSCEPGDPTTVTFTGTDECLNSATDTSTLTVVDTEAPTVICSVEIDELWPPNHKFVDVGFTFSAVDVCDADLDAQISVKSDEDPSEEPGSGGPNHCPDAIIEDDGHVLLSAERAGTGDGRIYVITVEITDDCGNVSACQQVVGVPHNMGANGDAVDSGVIYDAAPCGASDDDENDDSVAEPHRGRGRERSKKNYRERGRANRAKR